MKLNLSHYRRGTESKIWDKLPEYSWQNVPDIREAPEQELAPLTDARPWAKKTTREV